MDVHDSPRIQLRHHQNVDLSSSLAHQFLKKRTTVVEEDSHHYETIRKKIHTNEENDQRFYAETVKKCAASFDAEKTNEKVSNAENHYYTQSLSTIPLRQKYALLVSDFLPDEFSLEQKLLVRIQNRLDQHLIYIKNHRGKKKGQFFKSLRKNLIQGSQLIIELHHLKQILFIDNTLYIYSRERYKDHSYDILLDLPNTDVNIRKIIFKEKLIKYIQLQRSFDKNKRNVVIPLFKFPFQQKIQYNNQLLFEKREEELIQTQHEEAKQENQRINNPRNFFNKNFKFKEELYKQIKQKQAKLREKQSHNLRKYGKEEVLKIIDEIFLIYTSKTICNMFQISLAEVISKKLLILDNVVHEIIEFILDNVPQFIKRIENNKGIIVQIDAKKFKICREKIMAMQFQQ